MSTKTRMSVEDFDRLEEPDELNYELDEGDLVVMTKPRPLHNRIVAKFESYIRKVLQDADLLEASDLLPDFALRVGDLFG